MFIKCLVVFILLLEIVFGTYLSLNTNEKEETVQVVSVEEKEQADIKIVQLEKKLKVPEEYKNEDIIAKLEIPKIELTTYVIGNTTDKTLAKSVTKLCGPEVNMPGNLCITGHNYIQDNMFYKLRKLELGDEINLTDVYGKTYTYKIFTIEEVLPEDTSCLSQETFGERQVTLITCTIGAKKRLIVKGAEVYD